MKTRRYLALLLVLLMVIGLTAGCNNTSKPAETTTTPIIGTTKPTETTSAPLEDIKLNGYEFLLAPEDVGVWQGEGDTAAHAAVKEYLLEVEDFLDCRITILNIDRSTDNMTASAISGSKLADFISARQSSWIPLAMMGGLRALDAAEMLSAGLELFNEDCFNQDFTKMTEVNDKIWGLDMTSGQYMEEMSFGHLYAFNKRLVTDAGYAPDALYQAVRDGKWNYAMFLEIARKITKDVDGDGVNDIWGVALDCDGNESWTNGTGPIVRDASGRWVTNLSDPKLMKSFEFMASVSGDPQVQASLEDEAIGGRGNRRTLFYDGKAGFAGLYGGNFDVGIGLGRMNEPYGVLPMPKGDDVDHYVLNMVDVDVYISLISNDSWENGAKVMTEIGRRLYDKDYYNEYLMEILQGDAQAVEMMTDYLMPYSKMNIAKCTDDMYDLIRKDMYDNIYKGSVSPAAVAEMYEKAVQSELDKVFRQS